MGFDLDGWVGEASFWRKVFVVFGLGFLARLFLNLFFHFRWGWRAVNQIELWFYAGVADGSYVKYLHGGWLDPTVWILRPLGFLLPRDFLAYGVGFAGVFLSALTGVLVYVLVRQSQEGRTAVYSALIYSFMVEVLALSTVSFTHGLVQIPLMLSLMVVAGRLADSSSRREGLLLSGLYLAIAFFGFRVNVEMSVGVFISIAYALGLTVKKEYSGVYAGLVCLAIVLGGILILPPVLAGVVGRLPQG
ncbi:MAG TPA: hypothetical protein ENN13_04190, partial [Candidatus Altiarchaeales archaeon]|nr:hypothetical protein [Candidatus Altiarchaeales archaeon]